MHAQIRSKTAASAPDLAKFIAVLSEPQTAAGQPRRDRINIEGITGGGVEFDGEVVIAVEHGREFDARDWLVEAGYRAELIEDVFHRELSGNTPGTLVGAIREATGQTENVNHVIKDVLIGETTGRRGRFFVQVAFQEIRTG